MSQESKTHQEKSRLIIQKIVLQFRILYYEDRLHKLPTLNGLKGNFDCIFKEILSRQSELQIHHHYQTSQFLPSKFQESTFISMWKQHLALHGLANLCNHIFNES